MTHPNPIARRRLFAALLAALTLTAGAQPAATDTDADADATRLAREHADAVAAAGTPEHSAALRAALAAAGRARVDDRGRRRRGQTPSFAPAAALRGALVVDSDPRYQAWLAAQPAIFPLDALGRPDRFARSIGGRPVRDIRAFDEVTALLKTREGTICSGVLVGRRTVLTAAHCICEDPERVYIGRASPRDRWDHNSRVFDVADWDLPPGIQSGQASCKADAAGVRSRRGKDYGVVVLRRPVGRSLVRLPAHLPSSTHLAALRAGEDIYAVGFGRMGHTSATGRKNWVRVPLISPRCAGGDAARYGCVSGKELVSLDNAHGRSRHGPCGGDSGGAAFVRAFLNGDSSKPFFRLVGVVSRPLPGGRCGDATVYTLVNQGVRDRIDAAQR